MPTGWLWGWLTARRQCLACTPVGGKCCSIVAAAHEKVRGSMRLFRLQQPRTELIRREKGSPCLGRKTAFSKFFPFSHLPHPQQHVQKDVPPRSVFRYQGIQSRLNLGKGKIIGSGEGHSFGKGRQLPQVRVRGYYSASDEP